MKLPEVKHATGVTTIGLTGITILAGVIFANTRYYGFAEHY